MPAIVVIVAVIVAYFTGFVTGWSVPYISSAIRAGNGVIRALAHAVNEMERDADVLRGNEHVDDVIDV